MGYFLQIAEAIKESINDTNCSQNEILTKEIEDNLVILVMKKLKGRCNPKQIREFIQMEFFI